MTDTTTQDAKALYAALDRLLHVLDREGINSAGEGDLASACDDGDILLQALEGDYAGDCNVNFFSSRMCQRGTKGCVINHAD